jgi:hypothetical protein
MALNQHRLSVAELTAASGGVPGMPDCHFPSQGIKIGLPEYLGDEAHFRMDLYRFSVGGSDSGAFLATVLQCEQTEES